MIEFKLFQPYSEQLIAGMTEKSLGSFKADDPDFEAHVEALNLGQPIYPEQTHSDRILEVREPFQAPPEGDALITNQKGLLLMVRVADCQGIILYDPKKQALGVVHSGWKGSVQNILGKTIQKLITLYHCNPADMLMAVSPSLGPCCSEFTDPESELPGFCRPFILPNKHVDFWQLSKKQAMDEGLKAQNIEFSALCTKDDQRFFSHRLADAGRMAVFAKLL